MELLFIDGLPPTIGKGGILRLLTEVGQMLDEAADEYGAYPRPAQADRHR